MTKVDKEDLAARATKRAGFRLHHVGTKLNERELGELEALLDERGVTQGEFIRGLILAEIERDRAGVRASAELVEIMACKLLLVNFLRPLAVGKPLSAETFDSYIGEVRKYKTKGAAQQPAVADGEELGVASSGPEPSPTVHSISVSVLTTHCSNQFVQAIRSRNLRLRTIAVLLTSPRFQHKDEHSV